MTITIHDRDLHAAQQMWDYLRLNRPVSPCSAAIGLGSHDLGVATTAVGHYRAGLFPTLVFTGGNSRTTKDRFPRGEAVHYREHAIALGVPEDAVLVEPRAANTGQNITYTRTLLDQRGLAVDSVMLICKPYMERRAYATCRKVWPEVAVQCASERIGLEDYLAAIGDRKLVIDMLVGELQRIQEYPRLGFATEQRVPAPVRGAYDHLVRAGFDSRLVRP
ncbi:YdcF family protein [Streptomyces sp. NPDC057499]|uniref:YdcF family protein n=1 Tax=Streptomyces sp. NPDC057499 TaxID=3346150 RepID=UPI00369DC57A